jgi:hypothetical protein
MVRCSTSRKLSRVMWESKGHAWSPNLDNSVSVNFQMRGRKERPRHLQELRTATSTAELQDHVHRGGGAIVVFTVRDGGKNQRGYSSALQSDPPCFFLLPLLNLS